MIVRENTSLKELTTFKAGGNARYVIECRSLEDIEQGLLFAEEKKVPWYVLGKGSNMVPADEGFEGVIFLMKDESLFFEDKGEEEVHVVCGAGVVFDSLVSESCKRGLWGLENLAGIPGTVGAAPVQNIGAYGSEIAQTFLYAEVFDTNTGTSYRMERESCQFSYRDSIFKKALHLIILRVAFTLHLGGVPNISYPDLVKAQEEGAVLTTPTAIAETVRSIRAKKFPDWSVEGTAGSFFKNPIISEALYAKLTTQYGEIPQYPAEDGIKIPLAFILDKILGLRGYAIGGARLFERQPLVLVLTPGAPAHDIAVLAEDVTQKVFDATGITIEREPLSFPQK